MQTIFGHQSAKISCIWKVLKRKPASFWKTHRKIRIQYFQKPETVLYFLLCHIKFITFLTPGYNYQVIDDQLFFTGFIRSFPAHIRPEDILTRKTVKHHMSGKYKKAVFDPYFSVSHFFFSFSTPVLLFRNTFYHIRILQSRIPRLTIFEDSI